MTALEQRAWNAWVSWGLYAKHTICSKCSQERYCRARRRGTKFICVECFDQS